MPMAINNPITQNGTSNIIELVAFDSATGKYKTGLVYNTSGLVVEKSLNGAAWATIGTLVTMTEGTWTSLGFIESTNCPGTYQVGAPNANFTATGTIKYRIRVTSDDTVIGPIEAVAITGASVYAATVDADVKKFNGTALTDTELTGIPAANASLGDKIKYLFMLGRNKITQTATQQKLYADDGSTLVSTYTVSDDGTTATRGEAA